jgi:predicted RNase H-like nuclease (RuvC/YqgF family)
MNTELQQKEEAILKKHWHNHIFAGDKAVKEIHACMIEMYQLALQEREAEVERLKEENEELEAALKESASGYERYVKLYEQQEQRIKELEAQPSPPVELTEFIRRYVDIDSLDEPYVIGIEELTKAALSATPQPSPTVQEPSTEHKKEGGGQ